jgi:hypothetical protein
MRIMKNDIEGYILSAKCINSKGRGPKCHFPGESTIVDAVIYPNILGDEKEVPLPTLFPRIGDLCPFCNALLIFEYNTLRFERNVENKV